MKNSYKLICSLFFLFCFLFLVQNKTNAQCTLVSVDGSGTPVKARVNCDFPVFVTTGDQATDQAAQAAWISQVQSTYSWWSASSHFEIAQSAYDIMSSDRKDAITAAPQYFVILP